MSNNFCDFLWRFLLTCTRRKEVHLHVPGMHVSLAGVVRFCNLTFCVICFTGCGITGSYAFRLSSRTNDVGAVRGGCKIPSTMSKRKKSNEYVRRLQSALTVTVRQSCSVNDVSNDNVESNNHRKMDAQLLRTYVQ